LKDGLAATLGVFLSAACAWSLARGFRVGAMAAIGAAYGKGDRALSPVRFWLSAVYNAVFLVGGLVLSAHGVGLF
jgi:hypothetical protein